MKTSLYTPREFLSQMPQRIMVLIIRFAHGLITAYFLACITYIYYAGFTNQISAWAYVAVASLLLEGLVVGLNHGDCPLGVVHRKFGDQKAFFELFLPKRLAKTAVPVLGMVAGAGILLLFI